MNYNIIKRRTDTFDIIVISFYLLFKLFKKEPD